MSLAAYQVAPIERKNPGPWAEGQVERTDTRSIVVGDMCLRAFGLLDHGPWLRELTLVHRAVTKEPSSTNSQRRNLQRVNSFLASVAGAIMVVPGEDLRTTDAGTRGSRTVRTGALSYMYGGCATAQLTGVDDRTWIQDVTDVGLYIDYDGLPHRDMGPQLVALAAVQQTDALAMAERLKRLGLDSKRP